MPMFKGTGRSDNARVDISFSFFFQSSNQEFKCLSDDLPFVWLALKLVQKGLCALVNPCSACGTSGNDEVWQ